MQGIVRELAGQPHDLVRRRSSGSASRPWLPGLSGRTGRGGVRLGYRRGCCKPQSRILAVRTPRARAREADQGLPHASKAVCIGRVASTASQTRPFASARRRRVDRDLSSAVRSRVRESLVRAGVRANLFAGVTPSEAAIVDAAAARGVEVVRSHRHTSPGHRGLLSEVRPGGLPEEGHPQGVPF